jgi:hypothetical protein
MVWPLWNVSSDFVVCVESGVLVINHLLQTNFKHLALFKAAITILRWVLFLLFFLKNHQVLKGLGDHE